MAQVQRMSRLMVKTLRDDPADAETLSHKLLVRAGYVRRNSARIWTWLPLRKKVLDNISASYAEMDAVGAGVLLPGPAAQGALRGLGPLGGGTATSSSA